MNNVIELPVKKQVQTIDDLIKVLEGVRTLNGGNLDFEFVVENDDSDTFNLSGIEIWESDESGRYCIGVLSYV